jgi:hypothetical protein
VGGTNDGGQKQASKDYQKQIDWETEEMHSAGSAADEATEGAASGRQSHNPARSEELSAASTVAGQTEMAGPGRVESIEHQGEPD